VKYNLFFKYRYGTHALILSKIPANSLVLDVGCAQGYLAEFLKKNKDCTVYGIDLEKQAAQKAKRFCQEVISGDVEEICLKGKIWQQKFDVIILADLLEHLKDRGAVLAHLRRNLKTGGRIIVSMPNIAYFPMRIRLLLGRFNYEKVGIMDSTHLRFFTKESMNRMFCASGCKQISQEGVGHLSCRLGFIGHKLDQIWPQASAIQFVSVLGK
jgi:methionine biosynthesis protein MetW